MRDKPIYNLRTLLYVLTQPKRRLPVDLQSAIVSQTSVLLTDISHWEGGIDFAVMMAKGIAGTIPKVGQGSLYDEKFGTYWLDSKTAKLPRGTFWFYDSRVSPEVQAKKWAAMLEADPGEIMHFADFEENYGGPYGGSKNFRAFLEAFQYLSRLPDNRIGIYTGYYYWIAKVPLAEMDWFGKYQLWLASYNPPANVLIPRPWTQNTVVLWQYTDKGDGLFYGSSSAEIDLNYYVNGNLEHFQNRFGLIQNDNGGSGTMDTWKVNVAGLNIRSGAGGSYPTVGASLTAGDLVFGSLDAVTQWVHFVAIQRQGQPVQSLDGWCAAYPSAVTPYLVKVVSEPAKVLPVLNVALRGEGYPDLNIEWKPLA